MTTLATRRYGFASSPALFKILDTSGTDEWSGHLQSIFLPLQLLLVHPHRVTVVLLLLIVLRNSKCTAGELS